MPIIVNIPTITREGLGLKGEEPPEMLDLAGDPEAAPAQPVVYDLRATLVHAELLVQGDVRTTVSFRCARCLTWFPREIADPEFFRHCTILDKFGSLDLTADVREAIILAFPTAPVCREDCQGLCPGCGIDRNTGSCECAKMETDGPWSQLDQVDWS